MSVELSLRSRTEGKPFHYVRKDPKKTQALVEATRKCVRFGCFVFMSITLHNDGGTLSLLT